MGKPAARLGDMTAHGGTIVLGFPTVLIGGMPAARMGDMCVCVGPPDTIALGCFTVLIGEAGGGGGGGGASSAKVAPTPTATLAVPGALPAAPTAAETTIASLMLAWAGAALLSFRTPPPPPPVVSSPEAAREAAALGAKYPKLEPEFVRAVVDGARARGYEPEQLMWVMELESGFRPEVVNKLGYTGLIQIGKTVAKELGTTCEALAKMDRTEQVAYVFKYYDMRAKQVGKAETPGDLYAQVFWPAASGKPDAYVIARKGVLNSKGRDVYKDNTGLDFDKDGVVTKGDLEDKIKRYRKP